MVLDIRVWNIVTQTRAENSMSSESNAMYPAHLTATPFRVEDRITGIGARYVVDLETEHW